MSNWTERQLRTLRTLRRLREDLGRAPRLREWLASQPDASVETLYVDFGSFRAASQAVAEVFPGTERWNTPGGPTYGTRDQAIADLRRCQRELDADNLSRAQYAAWAGENSDALGVASIARLFGSWGAAKRAAGMEPLRVHAVEPGPALERSLSQLFSEAGRALSRGEYDRCRPARMPSAGRIAAHYPGSWSEAVRRAGWEPVRPGRRKREEVAA